LERVLTVRIVAVGTGQPAVVGGVIKVTVLVVRSAGVRRMLGVADMSKTTSGTAANVLRDALKLVKALLSTAEDTSLGLELVHGHGRQSSCLVVSGCVVVNLVNGDSGVDNIWLNNFLVDNRLDSLVDVLS
jgi:hypothetical protein